MDYFRFLQFSSENSAPPTHSTMAEEPQPSHIQEGADAPDVLPANKEDRKAAQALSSLNAKGSDDEDAKPKKEVDIKALQEAMHNLELMSSLQGPVSSTKKPSTSSSAGKKEETPKQLVKVDPADVNLLVSAMAR